VQTIPHMVQSLHETIISLSRIFNHNMINKLTTAQTPTETKIKMIEQNKQITLNDAKINTRNCAPWFNNQFNTQKFSGTNSSASHTPASTYNNYPTFNLRRRLELTMNKYPRKRFIASNSASTIVSTTALTTVSATSIQKVSTNASTITKNALSISRRSNNV